MSVPVVEALSTSQTGYQKTKKFKYQISRVKIWICNGLATQRRVKLEMRSVQVQPLAAALRSQFYTKRAGFTLTDQWEGKPVEW